MGTVTTPMTGSEILSRYLYEIFRLDWTWVVFASSRVSAAATRSSSFGAVGVALVAVFGMVYFLCFFDRF